MHIKSRLLVEVFIESVDEHSINQSVERYLVTSDHDLDVNVIESEVARHSVGEGSEYVTYHVFEARSLSMKEMVEEVAKAFHVDACYFDDRLTLVSLGSGVAFEVFAGEMPERSVMFDFAKGVVA